MRLIGALAIRIVLGVAAAGIVSVTFVVATWAVLEVLPFFVLTSALGAGLGAGFALGFIDPDGTRRALFAGIALGMLGGFIGTWIATLFGLDFLEAQAYSRRVLPSTISSGIAGALLIRGGYYVFRGLKYREY